MNFYEEHICRFVEENHTYELCKKNGEFVKNLPSVTQVLKGVGLTADYSNIPSRILKKAAERGTDIHKQVELYVKYGEISPTDDFKSIVECLHENNLSPKLSEFIVFDEHMAGTIDLVFSNDEICDLKTTAKFHTDSVAAQCSMYAYLYEKMTGRAVPGIKGLWHEATTKIIPLERFSDSEIVEIVAAFENEEQYGRKLLTDSKVQKLIAYEKKIAEYEKQKKNYEAYVAEYREHIKAEMKKRGIKSWESPNGEIKITYTPESERKGIDTVLFKQEHPELAEKYEKVTLVKDKITVTVRQL